MRLLFVSNLYPPITIGGYEQICFDVVQTLRSRGHTVHVLTSGFRSSEADDHEEGIYRRLRLKKRWQVPGSKIAPEDLFDSVPVQMSNVRGLRHLITKMRPQAVMFWNGMHLGHGILSVAEELCPVVYYLSDAWLAGVFPLQELRGNISPGRRLYQKALRALGIPSDKVRKDHLIFCSKALQDEYARLGVDVSRGTIIYHGISPDIFSLQPQHILQAEGEPRQIIYSGQIAPHKGVSTLVESLSKLRAMPGLELTRLGLLGSAHDPVYKEYLSEKITNLNLANAIDFLPWHSRAELGKTYGKYDVFAFPSEWYEPFSLALLEAMAVGIPVVSSLTGGSADIVRDGENAVAFEAGNAYDLAAKLAWVLSHSEQTAAMGRRASLQVRSHYTLDREVSAIEAYLWSVISGQSSL